MTRDPARMAGDGVNAAPHARVLGFVPLPALLATLCAITALYVLAAEVTKGWFYRTAP